MDATLHPGLVEAARLCRHTVARRWFVDETYVRVAGWRYVYRAIDEHSQVIDVLVSKRGDIAAAHRFFTAALAAHGEADEDITDRAAALANVIAESMPDVVHNTAQYANNRIETVHGRHCCVDGSRAGSEGFRSQTACSRWETMSGCTPKNSIPQRVNSSATSPKRSPTSA